MHIQQRREFSQNTFHRGLIDVYGKFFTHSRITNSGCRFYQYARFKNSAIKNYAEAKEFIQTLLKYRILLDNYIIKGDGQQSDRSWEIQELIIKKTDEKIFERKKILEDTSRIQSMLYVSTALDYWFTPTLKYIELHSPSNDKDPDFVLWLEKLDTLLASKRWENKQNALTDAANDVLKKLNTPSEPSSNGLNAIESVSLEEKQLDDKLNQELHSGTDTERYWFHRLDYYLWKKWRNGLAGDIPVLEKNSEKDIISQIDKFQFRQNRSVEHIHPQSPSVPVPKWEEDIMNSFGNLALMSVSSNSRYSNRSYEEKRGTFINLMKQSRIESLKLLDIYQNSVEEWTDEKCKVHQDKMIGVLKGSLGRF
ncbi:DUF1524 domain-containing protein [Deltaproteobacteria bacterium TL4]